MRSKVRFAIVALFVGVALSDAVTLKADFVPGNLVIYRVGTGTGSLVSTGNEVFIDEYTPAGALVQSIPMPSIVTDPVKLIASGTAFSEGLLTRSPDGTRLALTGYDTMVGGGSALSGTTASTINRTVATVDAAETITMYSFSDFASGSNPRSAVIDGSNLYIAGGAGGVRYKDASTIVPNSNSNTSLQLSTTVTNLRQTNIFGGQLYVSTASGSAVRIGSVGSGEPTTSGQTITNLPGFLTSGEPYAFFLADLSAGVTGLDTLYVASDDVSGLTKYTFDGLNWASDGTVGGTTDHYRGLTGSISGSTVTLYAVRLGGDDADGGGDFVSLVDSSGYDGTLSGAPSILATATLNTAFRGIAFAPIAVPEPAAVLFGGLVCGVVGLAAVARRLFGKEN